MERSKDLVCDAQLDRDDVAARHNNEGKTYIAEGFMPFTQRCAPGLSFCPARSSPAEL